MTQIIVVSGLSGAGKSTALHTLEDLGFFCIDNLPTVLAAETARACESGGIERIALGIDVRVGAFLGSFGEMLEALRADPSRTISVLFLDAADEAILRRFSETRRPHPLNMIEGTSALALLDGIRMERERLASLRGRADIVLDTTRSSVHELRRQVIDRLGPASGTAPRMQTRILSFGFKYGPPVDADIILDVRFIENPYFVPNLKALPGTDRQVADFVLNRDDTKEFLDKAEALLGFTLPRYEKEGKSYLTIGIGCTGGRHRSVAISEELGRRLGKLGHVTVAHRDLANDVSRNTGRFSQTELRGLAVPSLPPPKK